MLSFEYNNYEIKSAIILKWVIYDNSTRINALFVILWILYHLQINKSLIINYLSLKYNYGNRLTYYLITL